MKNVIEVALALLIQTLAGAIHAIKGKIQDITYELSDIENLQATIEGDITLAKYELELLATTPKAWMLISSYISSSELDLEKLEEESEILKKKLVGLKRELRKKEEEMVDASIELAKIKKRRKKK